MTTRRGYNFAAGPSMLPESVLKEVQDELLDWQSKDRSILEMGHRTPEFEQLMAEAEANLRNILHVPHEYEVLFLGGAARTQFSMVPLNCIAQNQKAGYLISGVWSSLAYEEACKVKSAFVVGTTATQSYTQVPKYEEGSLPNNTAYLYYTPNETINGNRYPYVPKPIGIPLIADMTSCLLTEPFNISDFALIFAGAQKNIANAGLTIVILNKEILNNQNPNLPTMFDYQTHISHHSLYATPPMFNCYLAAKMLQWMKHQGIENLYKQNCMKAERLYRYIDSTSFYKCSVEESARSRVNVCFSLKNLQLEALFIENAEKQGLYALKGHKKVGGLRASLYNAMPMAGVDSLIHFMQVFAEENDD